MFNAQSTSTVIWWRWWWWWWSLLYSAILRSRADSLRSHVILHEWIAYFIVRVWISTEVVYLQCWHGWCHMNLLLSRRVLCTPYNHAPCHFMQSHIRKVYACWAVTCHLHLWQNDRGLLRATAVTRGWNGHRNKSQHRRLTLEKNILPPLLQGFEPTTTLLHKTTLSNTNKSNIINRCIRNTHWYKYNY